MQRASINVLLVLLFVTTAAFGRINEDQGLLAQDATRVSAKLSPEQFFQKFLPLVMDSDGNCNLLDGLSETALYETLLKRFDMDEEAYKTTSTPADGEIEEGTLPGNVEIFDDVEPKDVCTLLTEPERIQTSTKSKLGTQLDDLLNCLANKAPRFKKELKAFAGLVADNSFDSADCRKTFPNFVEVGSQVTQTTKEWEMFILVPAVGLYVTSVVINIFRAPDQIMPEYVGSNSRVPDDVKVTVIEFQPASATDGSEFSDKISRNIKSLVGATPAGDNKNIAVWPEYAIVSDAYFDFLKNHRMFFNSFAMYMGGGSIPYGGFKSWKPDQAKPNCNAATYTLEHIACGAIKKRSYVVANILMKSAQWSLFNFYTKSLSVKVVNVNVVFNPEGNAIAIYEKMYPVPGEAIYAVHAPNDPDRQRVNINNVDFGLIVCYDALFPDAGYYRTDYHNVFYTTKWTGARDLVSVLVQQAYSRATRTNLFVSTCNWIVGERETGSGIFIAGKPQGTVTSSDRSEWPADYSESGFFLRRMREPLSFATVSSIVPLARRPERYFTDDDVSLSTRRDHIPIDARGRITIKVCAGSGCVGRLAPGTYTSNQADVLKITDVEKEIILKRGDHTCIFAIKLMNDVVGQEQYILQAENGFTTAEWQITSMLKSNILGVRNRKVLNCVLLRVPDYSNIASWSNYADASKAKSRLQVRVVANNFGSNTLVLPITGLSRGNDAKPPIEPFTIARTRRSSWIQGTTSDKTVLKLEQDAGDDRFFFAAGLYGVQQN